MMKIVTALRVGLLLVLLATPQQPAAQGGSARNRSLVIEGGTLIDGTGKAPLRDAVIVIEGNKIAAVGEKGKVSAPQGARVIQAGGKFILPGLSDMHVHWDNWMPELYLAHGVTSAVDLESGDWTLTQRDLIADGRMRGPRIFTATSSLYGRLLWDHPISSAAPSRPLLESAEMARRVVRSVGPGRARFNLTKTYTEITPQLLRAVVEESHKAGRNVISHLGIVDARQATEAGIDAVAHGSGIALATIKDPVKAEDLRTFAKLGISVDYPMFLMYHAYMDAAKADELAALMASRNVRIEFEQVNTAGRWVPRYKDAWLTEDRRLLQEPDLQYIPGEVRDRILYYEPWDQMDSQQRDLVARGYQNRKNFIRKFVQAGGRVLAGCDAASFVLPGICLHRELELLVEAGLTPMQAIQAATKNNFELLQEGDNLGTIEVGKLADLILVKSDPLADIRNTRAIDTVIKDGEIMDAGYHADFVNPAPRASAVAGGLRFINPTPSIRALYPPSSGEPNKEVRLVVEGNNLVDESVVEIEDVAVPTAPVKSTLLRETMFNPVYTQLTASIPGHLLSRTGTYKVVVRNPRPMGGASNVVNFFIAP